MLEEDATIAVRDGARIGARVYRPEGAGPYPALLAASCYRFDNNILPASPQFLWRETGPIDFYAQNGYAYVHMDVRGSGRSSGSFVFLGRKDQEDLYDVIEWIGTRPWCNGKVGGIGQSYFCMLQWFMGAVAPHPLPVSAPMTDCATSIGPAPIMAASPAISSRAIGGTRTGSSTAIRRAVPRAIRIPTSPR